MSQFPELRLRRLRISQTMRDLVCETHLSPSDFVMPIFVKEGIDAPVDIASMPGVQQLPLSHVANEAKTIADLKIPAVLLFGIPASKDACGSSSMQDDGIVQQAIREIKKAVPDLLVIADVCFCEFTDHGHCGVIGEHNHEPYLDNDATLENLSKQAVSFAKAGADMVAPSGMIDGMINSIRIGLDEAGFSLVPILSYAVKYASNYYGPFREAAEGAPKFGDRKQYQMNPANKNEALREAMQDIEEGADMIMVKPAQPYQDIIQLLKTEFPEVPMCCYQVSGEYAMINAAAQNDWIDLDKVMLESLLGLKRAGCDFIITYFAKRAASQLNNKD